MLERILKFIVDIEVRNSLSIILMFPDFFDRFLFPSIMDLSIPNS